ncbi:biopolymer transport protein TolR [Oryzisolibacter propanilivorax]|uniref:Biopolymer transport protein TolR n=1 Tax=Oryzisolibacter propanilivorax TaxID=1527607 RepID=A0A1G9Q4P6_9BURK|nr:biopolymer transporter ExbD [Oryzisolibacter propanilivorax]SDM05980.1 biopolymer transport protein TolR [Oryzisolibacter propanilivorax]
MAFGRFDSTRRSAPMGEINVTPLVDVMLVLVVIFILAAPLLASSIRLQLPRAEGAQPATGAAAGSIALALDASGQVWLQDQPIADEAGLAERLRQLAARQPDAEIALRADAGVPYGRVVQVMGAAHAAGLTRIGFVTEPAVRAAAEPSKTGAAGP